MVSGQPTRQTIVLDYSLLQTAVFLEFELATDRNFGQLTFLLIFSCRKFTLLAIFEISLDTPSGKGVVTKHLLYEGGDI